MSAEKILRQEKYASLKNLVLICEAMEEYAKEVNQSKEKQKQALIDMMKGDEELGLYKKPQQQSVDDLAKAELVDTIGRHNLTVSQTYKFKFSKKETKLFTEMMIRFANTLNQDKKP